METLIGSTSIVVVECILQRIRFLLYAFFVGDGIYPEKLI